MNLYPTFKKLIKKTVSFFYTPPLSSADIEQAIEKFDTDMWNLSDLPLNVRKYIHTRVVGRKMLYRKGSFLIPWEDSSWEFPNHGEQNYFEPGTYLSPCHQESLEKIYSMFNPERSYTWNLKHIMIDAYKDYKSQVMNQVMEKIQQNELVSQVAQKSTINLLTIINEKLGVGFTPQSSSTSSQVGNFEYQIPVAELPGLPDFLKILYEKVNKIDPQLVSECMLFRAENWRNYADIYMHKPNSNTIQACKDLAQECLINTSPVFIEKAQAIETIYTAVLANWGVQGHEAIEASLNLPIPF